VLTGAQGLPVGLSALTLHFPARLRRSHAETLAERAVKIGHAGEASEKSHVCNLALCVERIAEKPQRQKKALLEDEFSKARAGMLE
jgi:lauroyl/myristoyl acyltransferase